MPRPAALLPRSGRHDAPTSMPDAPCGRVASRPRPGRDGSHGPRRLSSSSPASSMRPQTAELLRLDGRDHLEHAPEVPGQPLRLPRGQPDGAEDDGWCSGSRTSARSTPASTHVVRGWPPCPDWTAALMRTAPSSCSRTRSTSRCRAARASRRTRTSRRDGRRYAPLFVTAPRHPRPGNPGRTAASRWCPAGISDGLLGAEWDPLDEAGLGPASRCRPNAGRRHLLRQLRAHMPSKANFTPTSRAAFSTSPTTPRHRTGDQPAHLLRRQARRLPTRTSSATAGQGLHLQACEAIACPASRHASLKANRARVSRLVGTGPLRAAFRPPPGQPRTGLAAPPGPAWRTRPARSPAGRGCACVDRGLSRFCRYRLRIRGVWVERRLRWIESVASSNPRPCHRPCTAPQPRGSPASCCRRSPPRSADRARELIAIPHGVARVGRPQHRQEQERPARHAPQRQGQPEIGVMVRVAQIGRDIEHAPPTPQWC